MSKENLKKIFADDPEVLRILEQRETNELLKEVVKDKLVNESKIKTVKVEYLKGEDGITPEKGKDYFTPEEVEEFKSEITPVKGEDYFTDDEIEQIKEDIRPIKGKDYFDGEDADEVKIFEALKAEIPTKEELIKEIPKVDEKGIIAKVLKQIPEPEIPTVSDIIGELKKKQYLEPKDIKGLPINMGDMRWHGSGLTKVSHDTTLTGDGTPSSPLHVVGSTSIVVGVTATSPITSSGGTMPDISTSMSTNKLIGRSTAGTGVMEEIAIGTNLTLIGGVLNATGGSANLDIGSSTISDGNGFGVLFDNSGILGEFGKYDPAGDGGTGSFDMFNNGTQTFGACGEFRIGAPGAPQFIQFTGSDLYLGNFLVFDGSFYNTCARWNFSSEVDVPGFMNACGGGILQGFQANTLAVNGLIVCGGYNLEGCGTFSGIPAFQNIVRDNANSNGGAYQILYAGTLGGQFLWTDLGVVASGIGGITTTITTSSLVGKTITVTNGLITGFA